ncbi:MAG: tetratricopeptide repeat protein [Thermanaeromonas sp.]|uniref:tetratricopeptide repeat protein n=1 Tax=Thermanaeromonas sp. TaxID=2003697 RepID=UPI00243C35E7|nr:tetratricopeptide repeat protein [Thermanaeromonas sp.]MCG0277000.1 tetratricopeptide repeat protein [Thermanaeromonas sp.]
MSNLRNLSRKRPVLGIALTVIISLGLIASYVFWALPSSNSANTGQATSELESQVEAWQKAAQQQIKQTEEEVKELEKQVQEKPEDAGLWLKLGDGHYTLGSLYLLTGNDTAKAETAFKGALASYQKVQELNPQEKGVYLRLAKTAVFLGDNNLAEANYRQAVAADPKDNSARMSYAMFLAWVKSDYQGAINQWQEILNNNPDEETAEHVREMIKQAQEMAQKSSGQGNE